MLDTIFDKIYVVWGRDPVRKEYIQNHFRKCNIENYKFVRSIVPDNLFITKDSKLKNRFQWLWVAASAKFDNILPANSSPHPLSLGEICCSYGHLKAYKTAIDDGVSNFLVIEDDAIMDLDLCLNALDWKEDIPEDWDILHFHSWRSFTGKRESRLVKSRKQVNDYFYTGYREYGGTVCYSLRIDIAKHLLARYYPIILSSDGVTASLSSSIWSRKFYNAYVFNPFLCINTLFDSQIDNEKQISEEFMTRNQRYSRENFNPDVF
jgi:GR25 family glycosyltransferase involved in LPS biosynthesis